MKTKTLKKIKAELNAAYKRPEAYPLERFNLLMCWAVTAMQRKHRKLTSLNSGKAKMTINPTLNPEDRAEQ